MADKKPSIKEAFQDLLAGHLSGKEFMNYVTTGKIDKEGITPELGGISSVGADPLGPMRFAQSYGSDVGSKLMDTIAHLAQGEGTKAYNSGVNTVGAALKPAQVPAMIAAPIPTAAGYLGSTAAVEAAKKAGPGMNLNPDQQQALENTAGILGGAPAGLVKLKSKLTPREQQVRNWQLQNDKYQEADKGLNLHKLDTDNAKIDLEGLQRKATTVKQDAENKVALLNAKTPGKNKAVQVANQYKNEDIRASEDKLNQLRKEAERQGKDSYASAQADYAMQEFGKKQELNKNQDALDAQTKKFNDHLSDMKDAEDAARKQAAADVRQQALKAQIDATMLKSGRNPKTGALLKKNQTVPDPTGEEGFSSTPDRALIDNRIKAMQLQEKARGITNGTEPIDFEHPVEVTNQKTRLEGSVRDAQKKLDQTQAELQAIQQDKMVHKAAAKQLGKDTPLPQSDELDTLNARADASRQMHRMAIQDQLAHIDEIAKAKQNVITAPAEANAAVAEASDKYDTLRKRGLQMEKEVEDLNPGKPPEAPLSKGQLTKAAGLEAIPVVAEEVGRHVAGGYGGMGAGGAAQYAVREALAEALKRKKANEVPRIEEPNVSPMAQALFGNNPALVNATVPNYLRMALAQQAGNSQQTDNNQEQ